MLSFRWGRVLSYWIITFRKDILIRCINGGFNNIGNSQQRVIRVEWRLLNNGWHKQNCAGAAKDNPENAGVGGLIRDRTGAMVLAFAKYLGHNSWA